MLLRRKSPISPPARRRSPRRAKRWRRHRAGRREQQPGGRCAGAGGNAAARGNRQRPPAEEALAEAREQRARLEVLRDGAAEALARLAREIRERLDVPPEALGELAGLAAGETPPDPAGTAARLDRLLRERDGIGPVNLVAEREAAETEARLAGLRHERAELTEAITRLRRGVAALNEEGRQRLARRSSGSTAISPGCSRAFSAAARRSWRWSTTPDPLAAGLEIMASPPGKRLQALSLLSGGEQALTALALVFAVFLTNPAPVCVLDEVDAPLDDANVDRFCRLVAEIADTAGTRFLVVTHHRITMARVDRLFGVTMAERGVSQLVSVDFARAAACAEPPEAAHTPVKRVLKSRRGTARDRRRRRVSLTRNIVRRGL